ncbi:4Fe-4S dicluster domain-containing protein [Chloroflexota bacterium]
MKAKIIQKKDIASLLDRLIKEYELFAPVKRDGLILFEAISSGNEAYLNYRSSKIPPKRIFFPQSEMLFSCSSAKDMTEMKVPPSLEKPLLVFGMHPCDAKGLMLLDKVFDGGCKDPYYINRRANTTVVNIGCTIPRTSCFCTTVGGGPFLAEGSDLLFIDIGDEYLVRIITDKGAQLLKDAPEFSDAKEDKLSGARQVIEAVENSMSNVLKVEGLKEKLDSMFDDPIWERVSEKCIDCGICTFLCPTCHCFDMVDEAVDTNAARIRIWDSCQYPLFTLEASGFNPRPTVKERCRQRIMHKFSYYIDNHGQRACVGCGRCITECPVNWDIRQALTTISQHEIAK